jgi:DNA polymerase-4
VSAVAQPDLFGFLHIDLNSFFASVEQQLHPEYRGKPTAVVPTMADTTCCIAASYEAKALGIKTGTRVGDAKKICPEIILVNGSHEKYAEFSHAIGEAVERICPVAHTPSIDEVVCQLMGRECEPPNARRNLRRDQAGHPRRRRRDPALLHRHGAQPLPGQDRQ